MQYNSFKNRMDNDIRKEINEYIIIWLMKIIKQNLKVKND